MTEPNADSILIAGNGTVYVGATSASAPTTVSSALTGFTALGFVAETGMAFTPSLTTADINAWQSFYPVRKLVTARAADLTIPLREWTAHVVQLAFGGGTISSTGAGYKFVPPSPGTLDSRSLIIDWQDNSKNYRLYVPTGLVTQVAAVPLVRTDNALLTLTFSATPSGTADAYNLFTNDPAWADYSL